MASWFLDYGLQARSFRFPMIERRNIDVSIARDWNCQGAIMHLNRGCEGWAVGQLEVRRALVEAGFSEEFVNSVIDRVKRNQFKRILPPIAKLTNRTVGYDFLYLRDWGT